MDRQTGLNHFLIYNGPLEVRFCYSLCFFKLSFRLCDIKFKCTKIQLMVTDRIITKHFMSRNISWQCQFIQNCFTLHHGLQKSYTSIPQCEFIRNFDNFYTPILLKFPLHHTYIEERTIHVICFQIMLYFNHIIISLG